MSENILPPVLPGDKQEDSKKGKKGFFSFLKKDKSKNKSDDLGLSDDSRDSEFSGDSKLNHDDLIPSLDNINENNINSDNDSKVSKPDSEELNLDDIRRRLGLDEKQDKQESRPKEEQKPELKKEVPDDDLSNLKEPPMIDSPDEIKDVPIFTEEPESKPNTANLNKSQKEIKDDKKINWVDDNSAEEKPKKSDFLSDVQNPNDNLIKHTDFTKELHPSEVKSFAEGLKRKQFESEKNLSYEPDVKIDDAVEEKVEPIVEEDEAIFEVSKSKKIPMKKKSVSEKKTPAKKTDKKIKPLKFSKSKKKVKNKILKVYDKDVELSSGKKQKTDFDNHRAKFEQEVYEAARDAIEKEIAEKLKLDVREEERNKLEKEFSKQKADFEKQKQLFEKEKIIVAGEKNKYEFRGKELAKQKKSFAKEKLDFNNKKAKDLVNVKKEISEERTEFKKEKLDAIKKEKHEISKEIKELRKERDQAKDILKNFPVMKKKYANLKSKIDFIEERIKINHKLEANIAKREQVLNDMQNKLEGTERRIRKKGFSDYLENEITDNRLISSSMSSDFSENNLLKTSRVELYNDIDECKSLILNKDVDSAKQIYHRLKMKYNSMRLNESEKELVYTALRELYDNIILASIPT